MTDEGVTGQGDALCPYIPCEDPMPEDATMTPPPRPDPYAVGLVRVRPSPRWRLDDDGLTRWYWRAERYQEGRARTVWSGWGTQEEVTRAIAAEVAKGAETAAVAAPVQVEAPLRVVADLMAWWAETIQADNEALPEPDRRSQHTLDGYRKSAEGLCWRKKGSTDPDDWRAHPIASVRLDGVTVEDLEAHVRLRRQQAASPGTIKNELGMLFRAWRYALDRRRLRLPMPGRPRLVVRTTRPKHTPSRGQVAQLLDVLERDDWRRMVLLLYAATGCRCSEIAGLERRGIEFRPAPPPAAVGAEIAVLHVVGKTGRRFVTIENATVIGELRWWLEAHPTGLLFGVTPSTVRHINGHLKDLCAGLQLPRLTTNSFRRLVDQELLRNPNVDLLAYRAQTGKSPTMALSSYVEPTVEDQVRAVRGARLGELPSGDVLPMTRTGAPAQRGDSSE